MIIRPAGLADTEAIARCIIMAEGEMIPFLTGESDEAKAVAKLVEWITSPVPNRYSPQYTLVAEVESIVVAAAIAFPADAQPELDTLILADLHRRGRDLERLFQEGVPGTYYLSTLGVVPEHRRRGIGSALMQAQEARAGEWGFSRTSLLVDKGKTRARALYERGGHRVAESVMLGDFGYYRMVREL